mgnify:CR=1 FL=1
MVPIEASCSGAGASDVWSPTISDGLRFFVCCNPVLKLIVVKDLVSFFSNNSLASLIFSCHLVSVSNGRCQLSVA